jgi:flagellar hook-associated protein 2
MATSAVSSASSGPSVQSLGVGSGLDIASIVSQLTTAEGAAQTAQLTDRQTTLQAQVSAYGTFRSALEALQATLTPIENASQFAGRTAAVGDTSIATASATSSATPGQYSIQVLNLAAAANLVSKPLVSADTVVGTGTLTVSLGGPAMQITVDSTNNTLAGIAAAINAAPNNPGVNATVVTADDGVRLILNGTKTGAVNAITVTQAGGDGGLASIAYDPAHNVNGLIQAQAATNAKVSVNGFTASSASNQVSGVISGVTLNLLQPTAASTPTTLTVGYDQSTAKSNIDAFVSAYNALVVSVQSLSGYDATTKTAGTLLGNSTVTTLLSRLQSIFNQVVPNNTGAPQSLTDLGITTNVSGTLDSNADKITAALSTNLDAIGSLLGGTNGITKQIDSLLTQYTQAGGLLDTINTGLQSGLSDVTKQQTALTSRLATYSATLTAQFNAMDAAVAALKSTQNFINQAFAALNNTSGTSSSSSSSSSG